MLYMHAHLDSHIFLYVDARGYIILFLLAGFKRFFTRDLSYHMPKMRKEDGALLQIPWAHSTWPHLLWTATYVIYQEKGRVMAEDDVIHHGRIFPCIQRPWGEQL